MAATGGKNQTTFELPSSDLQFNSRLFLKAPFVLLFFVICLWCSTCAIAWIYSKLTLTCNFCYQRSLPDAMPVCRPLLPCLPICKQSEHMTLIYHSYSYLGGDVVSGLAGSKACRIQLDWDLRRQSINFINTSSN